MVLGKLDSEIKINEVRPHPLTMYKNKLKMAYRLKPRHDIIKLLEEITGKTVSDINHTNFLVPQGNRNKKKSKQMGPNQTYKLFHSKGNHKWENIFANYATDKGLICKIYQQLIQQQQTIQSKKSRRPKQTFFQRRNIDG